MQNRPFKTRAIKTNDLSQVLNPVVLAAFKHKEYENHLKEKMTWVLTQDLSASEQALARRFKKIKDLERWLESCFSVDTLIECKHGACVTHYHFSAHEKIGFTPEGQLWREKLRWAYFFDHCNSFNEILPASKLDLVGYFIRSQSWAPLITAAIMAMGVSVMLGMLPVLMHAIVQGMGGESPVTVYKGLGGGLFVMGFMAYVMHMLIKASCFMHLNQKARELLLYHWLLRNPELRPKGFEERKEDGVLKTWGKRFKETFRKNVSLEKVIEDVLCWHRVDQDPTCNELKSLHQWVSDHEAEIRESLLIENIRKDLLEVYLHELVSPDPAKEE